MNKISTGALLDNRTDEAKAKDWLHEEFAQASKEPVIWEEKAKYKEYFPYDQASSLSCVAGGIAITIEDLEAKEGHFIVPSRKDIYYRRFNRPGGGMSMPDAFEIGKQGACYEDQLFSQGLGEVEMNRPYSITTFMTEARSKHGLANWISVRDITNYDELARLVDKTPLVAFWFFDNSIAYQEWWNKTPKIINQNLGLYGSNVARHQAAIVDRTMINGVKYFVIQDSAGVGTGLGANKNLRLVSTDFMFKRLYSVGYGINKPTPGELDKPSVDIQKTLKNGSTGDEVKQLQSVLIYEGLLAIKAPTGLFGGMTEKAVKNYQLKYADEILKPLGLKLPTGIVASATRAHINKKYK